jgi:hypothetical protein
MTSSEETRAFLESEVEALEPLAFLALGPPGKPLSFVEVARESDGTLCVRVPGRPPGLPALGAPARQVLAERGFSSEKADDVALAWTRRVRDPAEAVGLARALLVDLFGEKPGASVDVIHGSHHAEYEARERLRGLRQRLEPMLEAIAGHPCEQDADGDYVLGVGDVRVVIAPRVAPRGLPVVRIFTVTNVGVSISPELTVLLARLNFSLMFGRFVLDVSHATIWFDETLIGANVGEPELRFVIDLVASTGDFWDDRLKQMAGGITYQEALRSEGGRRAPTQKPGEGGYV